MEGWWDVWRRWCGEHPYTILYIVVVSTLNMVFSLVEVVK